MQYSNFVADMPVYLEYCIIIDKIWCCWFCVWYIFNRNKYSW